MCVISQILADCESDAFTISVQTTTGVVFSGELGKVDETSITVHLDGVNSFDVVYINKAHIVSAQIKSI